MPLKVEKEHPHGKKCHDFADALRWGLLIVIEGEPMIVGKPPKEATAGNVLTGEKYPQEFNLNMVIHFCPFCGEQVYADTSDDD